MKDEKAASSLMERFRILSHLPPPRRKPIGRREDENGMLSKREMTGGGVIIEGEADGRRLFVRTRAQGRRSGGGLRFREREFARMRRRKRGLSVSTEADARSPEEEELHLSFPSTLLLPPPLEAGKSSSASLPRQVRGHATSFFFTRAVWEIGCFSFAYPVNDLPPSL